MAGDLSVTGTDAGVPTKDYLPKRSHLQHTYLFIFRVSVAVAEEGLCGHVITSVWTGSLDPQHVMLSLWQDLVFVSWALLSPVMLASER